MGRWRQEPSGQSEPPEQEPPAGEGQQQPRLQGLVDRDKLHDSPIANPILQPPLGENPASSPPTRRPARRLLCPYPRAQEQSQQQHHLGIRALQYGVSPWDPLVGPDHLLFTQNALFGDFGFPTMEDSIQGPSDLMVQSEGQSQLPSRNPESPSSIQLVNKRSSQLQVEDLLISQQHVNDTTSHTEIPASKIPPADSQSPNAPEESLPADSVLGQSQDVKQDSVATNEIQSPNKHTLNGNTSDVDLALDALTVPHPSVHNAGIISSASAQFPTLPSTTISTHNVLDNGITVVEGNAIIQTMDTIPDGSLITQTPLEGEPDTSQQLFSTHAGLQDPFVYAPDLSFQGDSMVIHGTQDVEGTYSVATSEAPNRVAAFAKLEFDDGHFYMRTYSVALGRDVRASRLAMMAEMRAKKAETEADAPQTPVRTRDNDSVCLSHISASGGIVGRHDQVFSETHRKKPKRKRSKSTTSSSFYDTSNDHSQYYRDGKTDYQALAMDLMTGNGDINPDTLYPSLTDCPLIPIHPPSTDGNPSSHKGISRRHVEIAFNFKTSKWEMRVLGRNGAFLDGNWHPFESVVVLRHKSIIQIGGVQVKFLLPEEAEESDADDDDTGSIAGRISFDFEDGEGESIINPGEMVSESESEPLSNTLAPGYGDWADEDDEDESDSSESSEEEEEPTKAPIKRSKPVKAPQRVKLTLKSSAYKHGKKESHSNVKSRKKVVSPPPKSNLKTLSKSQSKAEANRRPKESEKEPKKSIAKPPPKRDNKAEKTLPSKKKPAVESPEAEKDRPSASAEEPKKATKMLTPQQDSQPSAENGNQVFVDGIGFVPFERRKGPGRPPKDGMMSKREKAALIRKMKDEEKARSLGIDPSELPQPPARNKPDKAPKDPKEDPGPDTAIKTTEGTPNDDGTPTQSADKKTAKPPKVQRSPSPVYQRSDFTDEQLSKPQNNYVYLLHEAILNSEKGHMNLQEIYKALVNKYPYFRFQETHGWQSSVRHNLNPPKDDKGNEKPHYFMRQSKDGKGHNWKLNPDMPFEPEKKKKAVSPARTSIPPRQPQAYYPPFPRQIPQGQPIGPYGTMPPYQGPSPSPYPAPPPRLPPGINGVPPNLTAPQPAGSYSSPYAQAAQQTAPRPSPYPPSTSPPNNGPPNNGLPKNGPPNNGPPNNGLPNNGPPNNGPGGRPPGPTGTPGSYPPPKYSRTHSPYVNTSQHVPNQHQPVPRPQQPLHEFLSPDSSVMRLFKEKFIEGSSPQDHRQEILDEAIERLLHPDKFAELGEPNPGVELIIKTIMHVYNGKVNSLNLSSPPPSAPTAPLRDIPAQQAPHPTPDMSLINTLKNVSETAKTKSQSDEQQGARPNSPSKANPSAPGVSSNNHIPPSTAASSSIPHTTTPLLTNPHQYLLNGTTSSTTPPYPYYQQVPTASMVATPAPTATMVVAPPAPTSPRSSTPIGSPSAFSAPTQHAVDMQTPQPPRPNLNLQHLSKPPAGHHSPVRPEYELLTPLGGSPRTEPDSRPASSAGFGLGLGVVAGVKRSLEDAGLGGDGDTEGGRGDEGGVSNVAPEPALTATKNIVTSVGSAKADMQKKEGSNMASVAENGDTVSGNPNKRVKVE
ncbi:hypothetical protein M501DRAFT_988267 [Patellaria atrata CBS 101060]|uniref:Fork-head domain-containing protein n=1 Tax=Patellaria atrata CBS 101060 TaxID=1346257 RepID=A0A9P4SFL8_9PEZI|nr:hypothetical protein M501DRAFT_988267 [Patellaria atrata CBS 101060]